MIKTYVTFNTPPDSRLISSKIAEMIEQNKTDVFEPNYVAFPSGIDAGNSIIAQRTWFSLEAATEWKNFILENYNDCVDSVEIIEDET